MTVSKKWAKLFDSLIGTSDMKYIIGTRCNMEEELTFGDKKYATMKYEFAKTIVKKYMDVFDESVVSDYENPNLKDEAIKKVIK